MNELNFTEQKILNYLRSWHTGKSRAVTYKSLSMALKISPRELRDIVAHLVTDHNELIATISSEGYFYIQTEDEYKHARAELISRIKKLSMRARGLRRGWIEKEKGQKKLFEMEAM